MKFARYFRPFINFLPIFYNIIQKGILSAYYLMHHMGGIEKFTVRLTSESAAILRWTVDRGIFGSVSEATECAVGMLAGSKMMPDEIAEAQKETRPGLQIDIAELTKGDSPVENTLKEVADRYLGREDRN